MEFSCGSQDLSVQGSVIVPVTANKMSLTQALKARVERQTETGKLRGRTEGHPRSLLQRRALRTDWADPHDNPDQRRSGRGQLGRLTAACKAMGSALGRERGPTHAMGRTPVMCACRFREDAVVPVEASPACALDESRQYRPRIGRHLLSLGEAEVCRAGPETTAARLYEGGPVVK